MKKKINKVLTAFLAVMMIVLSAMPLASAASLVDTTKKVSITLNCDKPGYTFKVYKVATLDHTSSSPYETAYNSLVSSVSDEILSGKSADILAALDEVETMPSTATNVATFTSSATSTSKTITGLAQGMYYVRATNYPAGVKSVTNSVVALPYYDDTESKWLYSIDAINLAEKVLDVTPETTKTITNSTKDNVNYTDVSLGDTVAFSLKSTTTGSTSMRLSKYTVFDDMSAGLTLNKNSFKVSLLKKDGTKITDLATNEYTVNVTKEAAGQNTTFNVALTNSYLQDTEFYGSDVYYCDVTYTATLNKYAVVGTQGNPNKEVELYYANKNGVEDEVEGNTVYVYTYAVKTNKTDETGKALAGAKFSLYKTEANAEAQTSEIATGVSDSTGKVLYYNAAGEEIRLQSGTYYIVETEAPEGYNVYGKVIPIEITAEYGDTFVNNTYVTSCPTDGYASVDVKDTIIVLPKTGGMGSGIFYIAGVLMFLSGVSILAFRKRRNADK